MAGRAGTYPGRTCRSGRSLGPIADRPGREGTYVSDKTRRDWRALETFATLPKRRNVIEVMQPDTANIRKVRLESLFENLNVTTVRYYKMGTKEILTLQFGHYSNFIGTHWWNIQESGFDYTTPDELNHDVLFREGINDQRQVTYTPRLLLVDLQGSLKALPERGELYDSPITKDEVEWERDKVEVRKVSESTKNRFQRDLAEPQGSGDVAKERSYDLDAEVEVWSDYLYTRFHHRTVNVVKEYQFKNENTSFDSFPTGTALWKTPRFEDDFADKIRNYLEECDNLQGFHVLADVADSFSGLSSACLEHLYDEYGRKSILTFASIPSHFADHEGESDEERAKALVMDSVRVLNTALAFEQFSNYSDLFVPLCTGTDGWRRPGTSREFEHLEYNHRLPYHTSAILAAALDTLTLKYRLKSTDCSLVDLCADLSSHGRKASAASLALPFHLSAGSNLLDCLDEWEGPLTQSITPSCSIGNEYLIQYLTLRGVSEAQLKRPSEKAGKQAKLPGYACGTIAEMLQMYLTYSTHCSANIVTSVVKGLDISAPYPKLFKPSMDGAVSVLAGLHCGAEVGKMLESLLVQANRIKMGRLHQFSGGDLEQDEVGERLNNLMSLRECYEEKLW